MPNGPFDFNNANCLNFWAGSSGVSVLSGATITVRDANAGLVYTSAAPDGPLLFGFTGVKFGSQTGGLGTNAFVSNAIFTSAVTLKVTNGQIQTTAGNALLPAYTFSSESSLGVYSSANSTIALSYGTFDLTAAVASIGSLKIKAGANQSCGTAILGSNGSVNVANTYVKTGDLIFLTDQTAGGTLGDIELGGIRNSSGFTIQSTSVTDTSTVAWLIVRPG